MYVDIVAYTICPWCFIGKFRMAGALAQSGRNDIMVAWRPFQLNPDMPAEGMSRDAYLTAKFGNTERWQKFYGAIAETGQGEGIDFHFEKIGRTPNTLGSHRLVKTAAKLGQQDTVVEALFRGYFMDGRDIGNLEILADIAGEAGLDRDEAIAYLRSVEDRDEVAAADVYARRLGINGVPCFIVNRKYAVSGAQPPEAFLQVFQLADQDDKEEAQQVTPA